MALPVTPPVLLVSAAHAYATATTDSIDCAVDCFGRMQSAGLKLGIATFLSLLNLFARRGEVDKAKGFIDKMPEVGIELNWLNYNAALTAMARSDEHSPAQRFEHFEELFNRDICKVALHSDQPILQCCNAILSACARISKFSACELDGSQVEEKSNKNQHIMIS